MNRIQYTPATQTTQPNTHSSLPEAGDALRLNRLLDELQPALRSLLLEHKALFLTVLYQLDGVGVLYGAAAQQHRFAPLSLSSAGVEAVTSLLASPRLNRFFSESEISTMALCCLLYEYGCMYVESLESDASACSSHSPVAPIPMDELMSRESYWHISGSTPYAHPHTHLLIEPVLAEVEYRDPELVGYLRTILGTERYQPFRIDSFLGPLGPNPLELQASHMRDCVLDVMGRVFLKLQPKPEATQAYRAPQSPQSPQSHSLPHIAKALENLRRSAEEFPKGIPTAASRVERELEIRREMRSDEAWRITPEPVEKPGDPTHKSTNEETDPAPEAPPTLRLGYTPFRPGQTAARPPILSLQWAAGMLDGDGCISIVRQTYGKQKRKPGLRLVVTLTQNCRQTLEHFRDSVGIDAPIYAAKRKLQHNRQVYVLNYAGPKAQRVIERLEGLMFRKRLEAQVAIDFCEKGQASRNFGRNGIPPEIQAIREACYLKLRALK